MTFDEKVEQEVNKRMAKRLLAEEEYWSGTFRIDSIDYNYKTMAFKGSRISAPSATTLKAEICPLGVGMGVLEPGTYIFIKLD